MVTVTLTEQGIIVTDGKCALRADTTPEKGGAGAGFRPHDLLAAALGACLAIQLRQFAVRERIPLTGATVKVELDRSTPGQTVFRKEVRLAHDLPPADRERLRALCAACPVQDTLSARLEFLLAD